MDLLLLLLTISGLTIAVVSLIFFLFFYCSYKESKKDYDNYFLQHPELSSEPLNNLYYTGVTTSKEMMKTTTIMAAIGIIPALLILLFI